MSFSRAKTPIRACRPCRPRPRLDAAAYGNRAAAARHSAPSGWRIPRKGLSRRCAAGRNHPAARRRANSLARSSRPCRGRSFGAARAGRPPRRALCRARQCRAAAGGTEAATRTFDGASRDTPEWLLKRWTRELTAPILRGRLRAANGHEPALDLTVKQRRRILGRTAARPRAADRHGAHTRAWRDLAVAGIFRRRLVGAGRRRRAAGSAVRRRPRQERCRPVRRARRQDRTARAGRRAASPQSIARRRGSTACARISPACLSMPKPSRPTLWNGRPGRSMLSCSMRPAPPPARSAAIPTCPGSRARPTSRPSRHAAPADRPRGRTDQARRHVRLLRLLTGARGRRESDRRPCSRAIRACARKSDYGRRRFSAMRNSLPATATCAHCRSNCPIPTRAGAGSMASMPRGLQRRYAA